MLQKEQGILLSTIRHNDKTSVVHIFTKSHGHVSFIFHLAKTGKSVARNTLLQPLTQIEFDTQYIPTNSLQQFREPKNISPYTDIPFNPVKRAVALFISEFLSYSLKEESKNERLFNYIENSINWLDGSSNFSNFHLIFMIGVTQFLGICPNSDNYLPGSFLDLQNGDFSKEEPSHNDYLSAELSYKFALLLSSEYDNMDNVPLTRQGRIQMLNCMNEYFKLHIPSFPTLKSIEILESIFE